MRRVAIAGVLAMRPKVLVLDEPTAGLDPAGRDSILSMVKELHAAGNLTVIMVTHSMDDISRLATRLVVLSKGALVLQGTPREVFSRVEEMEGWGLGVPQAAKLNYLLRKAGFKLPADLYTLPEVQEHILRLWKEAGSC
jgi:energy-coupling factor transport system ATP-binding protein